MNSSVNLGAGGHIQRFQDGGSVDPMQKTEEVGIMDYLSVPGAVVSQVVSGPGSTYVRESGRMGTPGAEELYGSDPSFMEQLVEEYNYPIEYDHQRTQSDILPMATEMGGGYDEGQLTNRRPRPDAPSYLELEDARAHMLGSAMAAQEHGAGVAQLMGNLKEFSDARLGANKASYADVLMDKRNNAVGINLFKKAGVNATPQQLVKMVDQEIFRQLDHILGRDETRRRKKSPGTGPDLYFPRDAAGNLATKAQ